jgi:LemA protein
MVWITVLVVVLIIGFLIARSYNSLVAKRNRVDTSWSHVEVQLQRRYDLIPNLVETVKGYATHESGTFERVVAARAAGQSASGPAEQTQADNLLTGALRQLFAVSEDYPELRASENFSSLQGDLSDTENKIAVSRQIYNDTVLTYNNAVQQLPSNIVASVTGFTTRVFYDAPEAADTAPEVSF